MALAKKQIVVIAGFFICALGASFAFAETPMLQTPAPVIYLADNLNESDSLGWCIDTLGRGFSEQLQAHSCKPNGGDVKFSYDEDSLQIKSVEFVGKCATLNTTPESKTDFDLLDCLPDTANQRFSYDSASLIFQLEEDDRYCITVGETSQSAGPYMSRSLELALCEDTAPEHKQWLILETP